MRFGRIGNYFWIGNLGWEIHKTCTSWVGFGTASKEYYGGTDWFFQADRKFWRIFWKREKK